VVVEIERVIAGEGGGTFKKNQNGPQHNLTCHCEHWGGAGPCVKLGIGAAGGGRD
jgi:hypothetical protein